jgi:transcriptional regulator with XRE-family HTH domain
LKLPRLKEVRELHGWSQAKLAEQSDVSRDSISNYETGQREAWPATAKKLADTLGVEIADLVARAEEPALAGKADAPKEAGPEDEETPGSLIDAEVLANMAELWNALLSRGLYDRDTLGKMYMAGGLLAMGHEANIAEYRGSLPPNLLKQLEAAEEQFIAVDGQILEMLEKTRRGHDAPADELAAKREARRQEFRGVRHARHG